MNQYDHTGRPTGDAPIYATLVRERGDVPAEVKRVAAQVLEEADRVVNFGSIRTV
ncbi:hypothetical protein [Streptomyces sp. NPDC053755]|uniref:hypothetical protein n=1 Tax=Streptomyces sp. NPDC053755 TaxID=3155815 RepID=UPI003444A984